jgi:hypothetical protein
MNNKLKPRNFYYKIWFDETDSLALVLDEEDLKGVDRWIVYQGKRIEAWPERVTFYAEGKHVEDYLAGGSWVVVSQRVRQVLEQSKIGGIQFLPVQIIHKRKDFVIGPYWVLNVVQVAEALDWENTHWARPERKNDDEHPILNIIRETFRWEAVRDLDIFLLSIKGEVGVSIYVSPHFKQCLEKAGATSGFKFIPIPAY